MTKELLRRFAQENFDDPDYEPVLHGYSEITKPLCLITKEKRPIWQRLFAGDEIIFLAGLEKYVSTDCKRKYRKAVESNVVNGIEMEKGENDPVDRYKDFNDPS